MNQPTDGPPGSSNSSKLTRHYFERTFPHSMIAFNDCRFVSKMSDDDSRGTNDPYGPYIPASLTA